MSSTIIFYKYSDPKHKVTMLCLEDISKYFCNAAMDKNIISPLFSKYLSQNIRKIVKLV